MHSTLQLRSVASLEAFAALLVIFQSDKLLEKLCCDFIGHLYFIKFQRAIFKYVYVCIYTWWGSERKDFFDKVMIE